MRNSGKGRFLPIILFLLCCFFGPHPFLFSQCPTTASLGGCDRTLGANGNLPNGAGAFGNGDVACLTANRANDINLRNRDNVTLYISAGITFSGNITNIGDGVTIINCGTHTPNFTFSSLNGTYRNFGTKNNNLIVSNGVDIYNEGSINGAVTISDNGEYINAGSQNNTVTVNNTALFRNNAFQQGTVTVNNSGRFENIGALKRGDLILRDNATSRNESSSLGDGAGQSNITASGNASHENFNASHTGNINFTGSSSYTSSNSGHTGNISLNGTANYTQTNASHTGSATLSGNSTFNNNGANDGPVTINGSARYISAGSQTGNVSVSNNGEYVNSGTHNGDVTTRNNGDVVNTGSMTIPNLDIESFSSTTSFTSSNTLTVQNAPTITGTVNLAGTITFQQGVTFSRAGTVVTFQDGADATINGQANLNQGAEVRTRNTSNTNPQTTLTINQGISIGNGTLDVGANTIVNVSQDLVQNFTSSVNISGEYNGRSIDLTNGGGNQLNFLGNSEINLTDELTVGNRLAVSGSSHVTIGGDLTITNSGGSRIDFEDTSVLLVQGSTSIQNNFTFSDNSFATFNGDVNISSSGSALLATSDNADILITANLTKPQFSGSISVQNSSLLVICDARQPNGTISGNFPPTTFSNMSIAPSPAYYGGCIILPVVFGEFEVTYDQLSRSAMLEWTTTAEWENSHFEIERAINQVASWEKIGEIPGLGYSQSLTNYQFKDLLTRAISGNIFYRLKQVDFNGSFSYSNVKAIAVPSTGSPQKWIVYPNPTTAAAIHIRPQVDLSEQSYSLRIISPVGKYEYRRLTSSDQIQQAAREMLQGKPQGLYLLEITSDSEREYHKIILTN
ncbi:hypothetical protein [Algoriphagus namhaensis]